DDNVVIASPTGSGKTVLFELAICRLIYNNRGPGSKIIYMALCSERVKDWSSKFRHLDLRCGALTLGKGDTNLADLPVVKESDIIITTPEKWDSISRRWRDSRSLVQMIRLFLIDEVLKSL
ncbi:putative DEAD/DEAH box DNA helicase, partial [Taphrina deformans PYCC 5710]